MDDNRRYEAFVRNRITELREQKGVSEHRMSLELGKSGSYIRSIPNGISMPSLRELFNIMEYPCRGRTSRWRGHIRCWGTKRTRSFRRRWRR